MVTCLKHDGSVAGNHSSSIVNPQLSHARIDEQAVSEFVGLGYVARALKRREFLSISRVRASLVAWHDVNQDVADAQLIHVCELVVGAVHV